MKKFLLVFFILAFPYSVFAVNPYDGLVANADLSGLKGVALSMLAVVVSMGLVMVAASILMSLLRRARDSSDSDAGSGISYEEYRYMNPPDADPDDRDIDDPYYDKGWG